MCVWFGRVHKKILRLTLLCPAFSTPSTTLFSGWNNWKSCFSQSYFPASSPTMARQLFLPFNIYYKEGGNKSDHSRAEAPGGKQQMLYRLLFQKVGENSFFLVRTRDGQEPLVRTSLFFIQTGVRNFRDLPPLASTHLEAAPPPQGTASKGALARGNRAGNCQTPVRTKKRTGANHQTGSVCQYPVRTATNPPLYLTGQTGIQLISI